ncbi:gamma-butyrobetaine dioxygenase [Herbihabitans rhizosphaerae]|uniref:Gamma-butyrobetaine dioxygenase n=1 Tax=Herbihabitans rhizosphaerae TaxID=1872711 RepID=A0A4Q7KEL1_9PSEU|nr:TauD/TfdA family dioxygenase [Herbihabitans rhizosphaerae]RZS32282.1 gamma-butyrobetaine dioxygenase [Herbihabitans rhizosphaerae]
MSDIGFTPARVAAVADAREALRRDGAVVLTGFEPTADGLVLAAAAVLGPRLRELFPLRERPSRDGGPVGLHADGFDIVVDVAGVLRRRRAPDEDHVLVQCVAPAPAGGDSFLADAYRFVDHLASADPELWRFLTTVDVDLYGGWPDVRGLPSTPRVGAHVEYTRTGRRIVRRGGGAVPLHRDPDAEHITAMLARFDEAVADLEGTLPRVPLEAGDVLLIDNFRCWHGRDPHEGDRLVRILTLRTAE